MGSMKSLELIIGNGGGIQTHVFTSGDTALQKVLPDSQAAFGRMTPCPYRVPLLNWACAVPSQGHSSTLQKVSYVTASVAFHGGCVPPHPPLCSRVVLLA